MSILHISTVQTNFDNDFALSLIQSITATENDLIILHVNWRKTGDITFDNPTWNGQPLVQIGTTLDQGDALNAVYSISANSSTTSNLLGGFSDYVFANASIVVLRSDSGVFTDSQLFTEFYDGGSFTSPSISIEDVTENSLILDFLTAEGWNGDYEDTTLVTWLPTGSAELLSSLQNTSYPALTRVYVSTTSDTGTVLTGWTPNTNTPRYGHIALLFDSPSGKSIDSITFPVVLGTPADITTSGLGALTSLTVNGKQVSSLTGGAGSSTFVLPLWTDGVEGFPLGTGLTTIASDGIDSASSTSITISPESTHDYIDIESVNTTVGYLGAYYSLNIGDQVKFPTASTLSVTTNYIDVDGGIYTDYAGSQIIHVRNYSTGVVTQITLINGVVSAGTTLVGKQVNVSLGTIVARGAASKSITGNQASISLGNITAKAGSVTSITGQQVGVSLGTITALGNIPVAPKIVILGNTSVQLGIGIGI